MSMRAIVSTSVVALAFLGAAPSAAPLLNQKTVLVTVVAPASGPLKTLTAGDFTLQEDKTPVEISSAELATDPLSIVVVVDLASPSGMAPPTQDLRRALNTFVSAVLAGQPDAKIAMLQVANSPTPLTDFTSSAADLQKQIGMIASQSQTGTVMLEGVVDAANRLSAMPAPRRAIVCVSFGSAEGSSMQPKKADEAVQKAGATLWTVSIEGSNDTEATNREAVWNMTTAASGGTRQTSVETTGLASQLAVVGNSLISQYSVTFSRKGDGALKPLKGETKSGAKVLATRWAH